MRKWLLVAAALFGTTSSVFAVCPSPLTGKDAANTTQNFGVTVDAGGNCYGNVSLVDGTAAANKAAVNATGQLAIAGPVTNAGTFVVQLSGATNNINNIAGTISLPTGAATSALQTTGNTSLTTINTTLGTPFQAGGSIGNTTFAVTNVGTFAVQDATLATDFGAPGATACTTDTASCSLNQQMQRLAQRLTTINTTLGTPFQAGGSIGNTTFTATQATGTNLHIVCDSGCSGSGGTSITDNAAFTTGTTAETPVGCYAGTPTATPNHSTIVACTTAGSVHTTVDNTNANGSAVSASSSPVVIASDQAAVAIKAASASIASGAFASGSIASGAIAAGAQVDLLTMRGTVAAGTAAANSMLTGAVFNTTAPTLTNGQQAAIQVSARGGALSGSQYPAGATPVTASATGTTAATTATLGTGASVTTYLCSLSIRANASAAATGNATVTGTITGTLNFTQWTAPNASGLGVAEMIFSPCVPASAVNTGIAVISAAPGTGGVVSVTASGYTL